MTPDEEIIYYNHSGKVLTSGRSALHRKSPDSGAGEGVARRNRHLAFLSLSESQDNSALFHCAFLFPNAQRRAANQIDLFRSLRLRSALKLLACKWDAVMLP